MATSDQNRSAAFDWEDARYFLALARAGSLSGAARALRVNHATVSRRIAALEGSLARVLFDRRPDGYGLTAHGEAAISIAMAMESAATALGETLSESGGDGIVRVTSVRSLADAFLVQRLRSLRAACPGIVVELVAGTRVLSLARREADIALRLGRPSDSTLVGRKLAEVCYRFYASRAAIAEPDGLIGFDRDAERIAEAAWLERRVSERPVVFRSNSSEAQAMAAREGFGVAMLPCYLGDPDPRLARIDYAQPMPPRELWLLTPAELARSPRVRPVVDALTQAVVHDRALLEGRQS